MTNSRLTKTNSSSGFILINIQPNATSEVENKTTNNDKEEKTLESNRLKELLQTRYVKDIVLLNLKSNDISILKQVSRDFYGKQPFRVKRKYEYARKGFDKCSTHAFSRGACHTGNYSHANLSEKDYLAKAWCLGKEVRSKEYVCSGNHDHCVCEACTMPLDFLVLRPLGGICGFFAGSIKDACTEEIRPYEGRPVFQNPTRQRMT